MYTANTSPQPLNEVSTEKLARFGAIYEDSIGRIFRYCRNGAAALTGGQVCQMAATPGSTWGRTTSSPKRVSADVSTNGGPAIAISIGSSVTENQYIDGLAVFGTVAGGTAQAGVIAGHLNGTSNTSEFYLENQTTRGNTLHTTGSLRGGIALSPYNGVVVAATDLTLPPVCVTQFAIPANAYFWGLVCGIGAATTQGTIVAGDAVMCSSSTAGAVTPYILTVPAGTDAAGGTLTPGQQFPIGWAVNPASTYTGMGSVLFNLP